MPSLRHPSWINLTEQHFYDWYSHIPFIWRVCQIERYPREESWPSAFRLRKESLVATKESLVATKESLVAIKESLVATKESLVAPKERLVATKESLVATKESLIATK